MSDVRVPAPATPSRRADSTGSCRAWWRRWPRESLAVYDFSGFRTIVDTRRRTGNPCCRPSSRPTRISKESCSTCRRPSRKRRNRSPAHGARRALPVRRRRLLRPGAPQGIASCSRRCSATGTTKKCGVILQNVRRAVASGGRLLVLERLLEPEAGAPLGVHGSPDARDRRRHRAVGARSYPPPARPPRGSSWRSVIPTGTAREHLRGSANLGSPRIPGRTRPSADPPLRPLFHRAARCYRIPQPETHSGR